MKVTHREVVLTNLSLAVVAIATLVAIGLLFATRQTPYVIPTYIPSKLSLELTANSDPNSLAQDIQGLGAVIVQLNKDQLTASSDLSSKIWQLSAPQILAKAKADFNFLSHELNSTQAMDSGSHSTLSCLLNSYTFLSKTRPTKCLTLKDARALAGQPPLLANKLKLLSSQIELVKVADDEQVAEIRLNKLAAKFNAAISSATNSSLSQTDLQADLTTLTSDQSLAAAISMTSETDLGSQQSVSLNFLRANQSALATAQRDIEAAINAATTIVSGLS